MSDSTAAPIPRWMSALPASPRLALVVLAIAGLAAGGIAAVVGAADLSRLIWSGATIPILLALLVEIVTSLRKGSVGLDLVAALSMSAALLFGEALAANVVGLMYAGGQLLEQFAEGRAKRELTALLGRVPRTAMRKRDGNLEQVPIGELVPGDVILIRAGDTLPADGTVVATTAVVNEAALTGEPLPVRRSAGEALLSGSINAGDAFEMTVTRPAAQSTYAHIVRLVEQAQQSKAPVARAADRLAVWFLLVTVTFAGAAWWFSGDHLRALAVLVVATPCPLILALPVALISGISRAAGQGILIKNGGALEALSRVRTVIVDKTGTLTHGVAHVAEIRTADATRDANELLRLVASLDQASNHVIAQALVAEARRRGLALTPPSAVAEATGSGITGRVEGYEVSAGGSRYVAARSSGDPYTLRAGLEPGVAVVAAAVDGELAGIIVLHDPLRDDAADVIDGFARHGVTRIVLASGDRQDVVDALASRLSLSAAIGDLSPEAKLDVVRQEVARAPTMMVGDGVNDAPALAAASVGVAMGARGSAASSQTAGVVILVDRLDRALGALEIAARTRTIATQSVAGGLLLSLAGMVVAAFGLLPPVAGALFQEAIDVVVILNALRALR
ncbi:MAG TPA: heavy metal translocating P-type ATPase [Devosia sp.]|jgi:heavy metal translocating P-type ATPase|uniref:heavy metal translocating P-type ATPase n=1 Tax=Devosia sp. TaxID=1871048 RepID=UPI002DDCC615|nr:heavy metal translocating P-type ATPase [Devosia sp.]HEV2516136.1 heavy metal translocating P-type ATPase [Devosia sp.]